MPNKDTAIEVTGLQMRYGDHVVLDGVDFALRRGEVLVLLGPNGAGKTTIIEILEGFRARSGGSVSVLGIDPEQADEAWRARVGIVLQSWRDHSAWQVRELLSHFGKYFGPYSTVERPRPIGTDELLHLVGLTDQAHKKVRDLSGGLRRRLDVAIGLVGNPELLFLDEPTVGFDPKARRELHDVIHRLADMQGTTILLSTHDLDEAEKLSDRILILAGGKIVADGSADQLTKEFSNQTEVIWTQDNQRHVHAGSDATTFARKLLAQHPEGISNLEIRHASLEDTYMNIVQTHEANSKAQKGDTQ
ncbi:MAG: ABC transporter ATP-binding protein [Anaerolineales bacterium]|nr:ABC transporter ATP-binding protein [Anaerolineales bacterium]